MMTGEAQFVGSCVALVTPFRDGAVDEAAFRKLVNWQIEQGTRAASFPWEPRVNPRR